MRTLKTIFAPKGKLAELKAAFPFVWGAGLAAVVLFHLAVLGIALLGPWFAVVSHVLFWAAAACFFAGVCALVWMTTQPNQGVAVLSPWTLIKDTFSARRPNG